MMLTLTPMIHRLLPTEINIIEVRQKGWAYFRKTTVHTLMITRTLVQVQHMHTHTYILSHSPPTLSLLFTSISFLLSFSVSPTLILCSIYHSFLLSVVVNASHVWHL